MTTLGKQNVLESIVLQSVEHTGVFLFHNMQELVLESGQRVLLLYYV